MCCPVWEAGIWKQLRCTCLEGSRAVEGSKSARVAVIGRLDLLRNGTLARLGPQVLRIARVLSHCRRSLSPREGSSRTRQRSLGPHLGYHILWVLPSSVGHRGWPRHSVGEATPGLHTQSGVCGDNLGGGYHTMALAEGPVSHSLLSVLTRKESCLDLLSLSCSLITCFFFLENVPLTTTITIINKDATFSLKDGDNKAEQNKGSFLILHSCSHDPNNDGSQWLISSLLCLLSSMGVQREHQRLTHRRESSSSESPLLNHEGKDYPNPYLKESWRKDRRKETDIWLSRIFKAENLEYRAFGIL